MEDRIVVTRKLRFASSKEAVASKHARLQSRYDPAS
jgi:hypothetical protein